MKLDDFNDRDVTAKPLSDDEKGFLDQNKDQLSDEQATKFGIEKTVKIPDPEIRGGRSTTTPPAGDKKSKTEEEDDDDLTDPEDKAKIGKILQKGLAPLQKQFEDTQKQLQEQKDISEADDFVRNAGDKYPEAGKYRNDILRYMKAHPTVTAKGAYFMVAGDQLLAIGAKKEREAAAKAGATRTNTSSVRSGGEGKKDWGNASADEIKAERQRLFGRPN